MPGSLGNLGGVSYDIIAEDKTQDGVESSLAGIARVTAAFAALNVAATYVSGATDAYDKLSETSVLTSYKLGTTVKVMNDMVLETADAHHGVTEVSQAFDLLARAGVGLDKLESDFKVFGEIGEVVGESAVSVEYEMIPALKAFGISIDEVGQYADVFTSVVRNTTMSLGEFTGFIARSALNLKSLGLSIEDTAAIFQILTDKGIQGRQAMRVFSQAMQDQGDAQKYAQKAAEDYADAQEELNRIQEKSIRSEEEYAIRMAYTGRNVAEARRLTMERRIELIRDRDDANKAQDKMAEAQTRIDSAKDNKFDVYKALGVTEEEVKAKKDLMESNKGMTTELANLKAEFVPASDKLANSMDEANIAAGNLLEPIKDVAVQIKTLSAVLTVVGVGAGVLKAAGALKGAGAAGGIAGGLGKAGGLAGGAGGIAGAEVGIGSAGAFAAGAGPEAAETAAMWGDAAAMEGSLGVGEAGMLAGGGATAAGGGAAGTSLGALALPALAGAALGGAVVFGMEKLGLLGLTGKGAVRSAGEVVGGTVYKAGYDTADTAKVISIGAVQLSKDYDFNRFMKDMDTYMGIKRMQRGVRPI